MNTRNGLKWDLGCLSLEKTAVHAFKWHKLWRNVDERPTFGPSVPRSVHYSTSQQIATISSRATYIHTIYTQQRQAGSVAKL